MKYIRPSLSYLESEGMIAFAQTGDFFVTFTNEQNSCCEDDDCGPPDNVPIPTTISVNDGMISIIFGGVDCDLQGNINQDGEFEIFLDLEETENCDFNDGPDCPDIGNEPNNCCPITSVVTITGTYQDGHLEASYVTEDSIDEGDPDCNVQEDCTETGDFSGDFQ